MSIIRAIVFLIFIFWLCVGIISSYDFTDSFKEQVPGQAKIFDEDNLLGNTANTLKAMQAFEEKTNIQVVLLAVDNEEWQRKNSTLAYYAANKYTDLWPNDETKWLIVYADDKVKKDSSDMNSYFKSGWRFEGVQGDDTDSILTLKATDAFNTEVTRSMNQNNDPAKAFTDGFDKLTKTVIVPKLSPAKRVALGLIVFLIFQMVIAAVIVAQVIRRICSYIYKD